MGLVNVKPFSSKNKEVRERKLVREFVLKREFLWRKMRSWEVYKGRGKPGEWVFQEGEAMEDNSDTDNEERGLGRFRSCLRSF